MVGETYLSEEDVLKELKINRAQLEDLIRTGKILPSYQDGVRKFKASEIEKLKSEKIEETVVAPPPPPPPEAPPPPPPTEEIGSTRVIEPPKEAPKLRVKRQAPPKEKPEFLKGPKPKKEEKVVPVGKLPAILLLLSIIVLGLSLWSLYFSWKEASLPGFLATLVKMVAGSGG